MTPHDTPRLAEQTAAELAAIHRALALLAGAVNAQTPGAARSLADALRRQAEREADKPMMAAALRNIANDIALASDQAG